MESSENPYPLRIFQGTLSWPPTFQLFLNFKKSLFAKTKVVQRKIVVLHSGIRFGYYAFTLKNCDRD
jgi:hypothetical protein